MSEKFVKPIHLACGDDELRPVMQLIRIKDGQAEATNGILLVRQALKDTTLISAENAELMEGKLIHKAVWKEFLKATSLVVVGEQIHIETEAGNVIFEFSPETELFPNVETILDRHEVKAVEQIGINPKLLHTLSKVFESNNLKLSFNGENNGIFITPVGTEGEVAILMPITTEVF